MVYSSIIMCNIQSGAYDVQIYIMYIMKSLDH